MLKRGDNAKGFNAPQMAVDILVELEALERLGPNARAALQNAPIKFSAATIFMDMPEGIDVLDPDVDRLIAREVMMQSMLIVAQDRSREDAMASVRPLRGIPSPRSMREQRKAQRAARW